MTTPATARTTRRRSPSTPQSTQRSQRRRWPAEGGGSGGAGGGCSETLDCSLTSIRLADGDGQGAAPFRITAVGGAPSPDPETFRPGRGVDRVRRVTDDGQRSAVVQPVREVEADRPDDGVVTEPEPDRVLHHRADVVEVERAHADEPGIEEDRHGQRTDDPVAELDRAVPDAVPAHRDV